MKFCLQDVARALGLVAPDAAATRVVEGWSIDSRTMEEGDLFIALRGPQFDGHAYTAEAFRKGAAAVIVDHAIDGPGCILRVEDTLHALQTLARWARNRWHGQVVAVTGSAGKTTTKDVIAEMVSVGLKTSKTEGNLNNHIGLPLSLLRLDESARVAVLELGMNHAGEIRQLAEIARPDVGVVTNVGFAHMENFDSIDGVAAAKRELIEALPKTGTAVLNADDARVAYFAEAHSGPVVLYGESAAAQIRGEDVVSTGAGTRFRVGPVNFETGLIGRHNVSNILAGIAVASIYGISPEKLTEQVRKLAPGKMRGERIEHKGILIYNDCYNSNPDAARAMLDTLQGTSARKRIAVLGEMLELGSAADQLHRDVGAYAAHCQIDVLIAIQGAAAQLLQGAGAAGLKSSQLFFFDNPREAGNLARALAAPGDAILFKGSRGVHVEHALEQFLLSDRGGN